MDCRLTSPCARARIQKEIEETARNRGVEEKSEVNEPTRDRMAVASVSDEAATCK